MTVTSSDTDITGASMSITNYQSGDSLNCTPIDGITVASNSAGVLTLTGSATPAQYQAALQSVTFSTTSTNTTTRTVDVVALDTNDTGNVPSNTGVDSSLWRSPRSPLRWSRRQYFQTLALFNFNGTNGTYPEGSLTLSGSTLYGMTQFGGRTTTAPFSAFR